LTKRLKRFRLRNLKRLLLIQVRGNFRIIKGMILVKDSLNQIKRKKQEDMCKKLDNIWKILDPKVIIDVSLYYYL